MQAQPSQLQHQALQSAGTDAANYTYLQPTLNADITPKPSTVTALDRTKAYGTTVTFSGTEVIITGLVHGDAIPALTITSAGAPATSNAGTYPIIVSGGSDPNYAFTYVNGVLTVDKADQVITFAEIPSDLRMTQTYQLDATSSSGLPVSFTVSDPNIASVNGNTLTINQDGTFTITCLSGR